MDSNRFFSGASGLVLPVSNKQLYPPEFQCRSRLCYYASLFNSIEINSSFYKIPMASTIRKWKDDVPDNFRFTFKLFKEVSHAKGLLYKEEDVVRFMEVIAEAGEKRGCLLVQFPPSLSADHIGQLQKLLTDLSQAGAGKWKIAIEFRNRSWYQEEIYELLNEYDSGLVLHDMPSSSAPLLDQQADFMYLRFHGPNGGYRGSYTEDFLSEYAYYVKDWIDEGKTVYAYFNNTMGDALRNLVSLNTLYNNELEFLILKNSAPGLKKPV